MRIGPPCGEMVPPNSWTGAYTNGERTTPFAPAVVPLTEAANRPDRRGALRAASVATICAASRVTC